MIEKTCADAQAKNVKVPEQQEEILEACEAWLAKVAPACARIQIDSRRIEQGDVFAAIRGGAVDGLSYAPVAASRHASAMLVEDREDLLGKNAGLPMHVVPGLKTLLGEVASRFYGRPSAHMRGAAVTGTNGKTSISHWVGAALTRLHHPCAVIGTIGAFLNGRELPAPSLTTPDAASMQEILASAYSLGAQAFALEASSIGLEQGRLKGTQLETAAFTNLTRDHLDYHKTLEAYERAKAILFTWPELRNAVVNIDDPAGVRLAHIALDHGVRLITYSLEGKTLAGGEAINAEAIENLPHGIGFTVHWQGADYPVRASVIGRFNVSNLLATAGILLTFGIDAPAVFAQLERLTAPAGRLEVVRSGSSSESASASGPFADPLVIVDYAHTPDALIKVMTALNEVLASRPGGVLSTVFGAGGDRDHGKRPLMGAAAGSLSGRIVITSDNPRSEDPQAIAEAVAAGVAEADRAKMTVELDRRRAIIEAVCAAGANDIVLIAGKGHETYQEVNGVRSHFSDVQVAREALLERHARILRQKEAEGLG